MAGYTEKEKKLVAYHEAGHAVVTYYCPTQDPVHQISIIPRGMAGGFTMQLPSEDKSYVSKGEMLDELVVLLGGRVAEAITLSDISSGASNDIDRASSLARDMVARYGMCERLGTVSYLSGGEVFRSGCTFHRGNGKIFYFRPGHESFPTFYDENVKKVLVNAAHWANSEKGIFQFYGHYPSPETGKLRENE